MKTKFVKLAFVLALIVTVQLPAWTQDKKTEQSEQSITSNTDSATVNETMKAADNEPDEFKAQVEEAISYYNKRDQDGMNDKAIALYRSILEKEPLHYTAGWKLAKALFWKANHEDDKQKALAYLSEGETVGKRLVEKYPDKKDGLFWYGVSLGRASERRGILNSLFAVGPMHDTMKKILEINPKDADAHHFLGVLYRKAPGWPLSIGDSNKSLHHAELATKYAPEDVLSVLDLGRTLKSRGKKEEAKKLFEKVLTMSGLSDRQPETAEYKEEAKEELAKLN